MHRMLLGMQGEILIWISQKGGHRAQAGAFEQRVLISFAAYCHALFHFPRKRKMFFVRQAVHHSHLHISVIYESSFARACTFAFFADKLKSILLESLDSEHKHMIQRQSNVLLFRDNISRFPNLRTKCFADIHDTNQLSHVVKFSESLLENAIIDPCRAPFSQKENPGVAQFFFYATGSSYRHYEE